MEDNREIWGLLEVGVPPNNSFQVKYEVNQTDRSELVSSISVRVVKEGFKQAKISVRALDKTEIDMTMDVKFINRSELSATMQPVMASYLFSSIEVNPHNRMMTKYELIPAPIVTESIKSTKDSMTRSGNGYRTLNYGSEKTMTVGARSGSEFNSFIDFDIQLPQDIVILNAGMKFYYTGALPSNPKINLYSVDREWTEYSITHDNKPSKLGLITSLYTVNESEASITFEMKQEILELLSGSTTREGYTVVLENNSSNEYFSLYTKESDKPPAIVVEYLDSSKAYSGGRSEQKGTIDIVGVTGSELKATMVLYNPWLSETLDSTIYVHQLNVPVEKDLKSTIIANRHTLDGKLSVAQKKNEDFKSILSVAEKRSSEPLAKMAVTRDILSASIYVAEQSHLDSTLLVFKGLEQPLESSISVSRQELRCTIFSDTFYHKEVDSTILIYKPMNDEREAFIGVRRDDLRSTIFIRAVEDEDNDSTIFIVGYGEKSLISHISATRESLRAKIYVRGKSFLDATISPRVLVNKNDKKPILESTLGITRDILSGTILVRGSKFLDGTIKAVYPDKDETEVSIGVSRREIKASIGVDSPASYMYATIIANRPDLHATIFQGKEGKLFLESTIVPRILDASDLNIVMRTQEQKATAYYFIL